MNQKTLTRLRVVFISSTSTGGGVAEMMGPIICLLRELKIESSWVVIEDTRTQPKRPEDSPSPLTFFGLTKRIHNLIHASGEPLPFLRPPAIAGKDQSDGEDVLTESAWEEGPEITEMRRLFEAVAEDNTKELLQKFYPDPDPDRDIIIVHDPQPSAMVLYLKQWYPNLVCLWRCHIGLDQHNEQTESAWRFLDPYLAQYDACIFSAPEYIRHTVRDSAFIVHPGIAPLAPKNKELSPFDMTQILLRAGLMKCDVICGKSTSRADGPRSLQQEPSVASSSERNLLRASGDQTAGQSAVEPLDDAESGAGNAEPQHAKDTHHHRHRHSDPRERWGPVCPVDPPFSNRAVIYGDDNLPCACDNDRGDEPAYDGIHGMVSNVEGGGNAMSKENDDVDAKEIRGRAAAPFSRTDVARVPADALYPPCECPTDIGPHVPAPHPEPMHTRSHSLPSNAPPAPDAVQQPRFVEIRGRRVLRRRGGIEFYFRPIVTQISRWDRLKGWLPLLNAWRHIKENIPWYSSRLLMGSPQEITSHGHDRHRSMLESAILVLAGPEPHSIADDPEGLLVLEEIKAAWRALPSHVRDDIKIVELPMKNFTENAIICNALQRASTVIVQNSLREGWGLTASEALYKGVAFIGTAQAVGLRHQVRHGIDGLLVQGSPEDPKAVAECINTLLGNDLLRQKLAVNGQRRAVEELLLYTQMEQWNALIVGFMRRPRLVSGMTPTPSTVGSAVETPAPGESAPGERKQKTTVGHLRWATPSSFRSEAETPTSADMRLREEVEADILDAERQNKRNRSATAPPMGTSQESLPRFPRARSIPACLLPAVGQPPSKGICESDYDLDRAEALQDTVPGVHLAALSPTSFDRGIEAMASRVRGLEVGEPDLHMVQHPSPYVAGKPPLARRPAEKTHDVTSTVKAPEHDVMKAAPASEATPEQCEGSSIVPATGTFAHPRPAAGIPQPPIPPSPLAESPLVSLVPAMVAAGAVTAAIPRQRTEALERWNFLRRRLSLRSIRDARAFIDRLRELPSPSFSASPFHSYVEPELSNVARAQRRLYYRQGQGTATYDEQTPSSATDPSVHETPHSLTQPAIPADETPDSIPSEDTAVLGASPSPTPEPEPLLDVLLPPRPPSPAPPLPEK
jgi:glycosyltransferase involved in cell wall biosynthesis